MKGFVIIFYILINTLKGCVNFKQKFLFQDSLIFNTYGITTKNNSKKRIQKKKHIQSGIMINSIHAKVA